MKACNLIDHNQAHLLSQIGTLGSPLTLKRTNVNFWSSQTSNKLVEIISFSTSTTYSEVTLFPETKISVMHAEQLYTLQKIQLSRSRCHFFDRSPPLPINSIANQFDRVWMMYQQNVRTSNQFVKSFTRSCRPTIYELKTK